MYSDQIILSHEPFFDDLADRSNQRCQQIKRIMPITARICLLVFLLLLTLILILIVTIKQQPSSVTTTKLATSSENIAITLTTSNEFNRTGNYLCV